MSTSYTAVVQRRDRWWIGWVEEVPGVSSQGETREELMENLRSALEEALEMNLCQGDEDADLALVRAIQEGEDSGLVSREVIFRLLDPPK